MPVEGHGSEPDDEGRATSVAADAGDSDGGEGEGSAAGGDIGGAHNGSDVRLPSEWERGLKSSGVAGFCGDERAAVGADSGVGEKADGGVAAGVVAVDWAEVSVMRHASEMRSRCSMQRRWRRGGFAGAPRRVLGCWRSVAGANRTASVAQGKE